MLIRPIDYFLVVWFALAVASTVYVAWDQYRNNPEPTNADHEYTILLQEWLIRQGLTYPAMPNGRRPAKLLHY
jgi:hypothetical protein